jgi:hypothetical protein
MGKQRSSPNRGHLGKTKTTTKAERCKYCGKALRKENKSGNCNWCHDNEKRIKKLNNNRLKELLEGVVNPRDIIFGFQLVVKGNSGNCSITKEEEEFIKNEVAKVFQNRRIDNFDITLIC